MFKARKVEETPEDLAHVFLGVGVRALAVVTESGWVWLVDQDTHSSPLVISYIPFGRKEPRPLSIEKAEGIDSWILADHSVEGETAFRLVLQKDGRAVVASDRVVHAFDSVRY